MDQKMNRVLYMQQAFLSGKILNKKELAQRFNVTEKSIQRDLESLRSFFAEQSNRYDLLYDAKQKGYRLMGELGSCLTNSEVLAVSKILLESRALTQGEMFPILDKLIANCTPQENLKPVQELIQNERFHYVPPHHGKAFAQSLWDLGTAVRDHKMIEIAYQKTHDGGVSVRTLQPVGILFSEYYFYLAAFIDGIDKQTHFVNPQDNAPTIYRIDKISKYKVLDTHFAIPYKDRFQEGEMRKRIQFMYGGKLEKIKFAYTGPNIEAVLDRLPTARVLGERVVDPETGVVQDVPVVEESPPTAKKESIIEAEVYSGNGLDMWLRSQGDWVTLHP